MGERSVDPGKRQVLRLTLLVVGIAAAGCGEAAAVTTSAGNGGAGGTGTGGETSSTAHGGSGGAGGNGGTSGDIPGWHTLAPLPAGPRQECAVVALNGKVYVIGGFDETAEVVDIVEVYDPKTGVWASAAPLPEPLHHVNAAVVDGKIYLLGALETILFTASGKGLVYDPAADAWSEVASLPAGRERGGGAVGVIGKHVYIAGGFRGDSVADVDRYDTTTDAWEALPPLPEPRDHLVGGVVGNAFFAIGGRNGGIGELREHVDRFDPGQGTWEAVAPMITARGGAAAGVLGSRIHVIGGEGNKGDPSGVFPQNEAYDAVANAWSSEPPMAMPKHGTGGAVIGGKLYVPGGATVQAFGATDDVQVFVP